MQATQEAALTMSAVIERAKATRKRATELNTRTGDTTFPVQNKEELLAWVRGQLNGARRASEIADFSALLLPALDATLEACALAECPDTIEVLGAQRKVEYRAGVAPRVQLGQDVWESRAWLALPDGEFRLPGGRLVEIGIQYGSWSDYSVRATDGTQLKAMARAKADERAWSAWPSEGRPVIMLPNPAEPTATVPEIVEACYGTSVIDGTPLVGFGAVECADYWSAEKFRAGWFRTLAEAETARTEAVAKLESLREEAIKQTKVEAARIQAEASKAAVAGLESREGWYEVVSSELRSRVYNRRWTYIPSGLEEILVYTQENEAILAEAEQAFVAKAENDAKLAAAEAAGTLLRRLEVTCDTRYGEGRVWVVRADGTLRERDAYGDASARRYTCYVWTNISDELVLVDSVTSVVGAPNAMFERGGTGVLWRPATVTREQVAATEAIENEHGLAGTFEVSPELVAARAAMIAELHQEILRLSPRENVEKLRFIDVSKGDGWNLSAWAWDEALSRRLHAQIGYMEKGQPMKLLREVRCAGGVLEFLAYMKYGGYQINARWRALTDEERASVSTPTAEPAAVDAVTAGTTFTHVGNRDFRCACGCCTRVEKNQMVRIHAGEVLTATCSICGKSGEVRKG